MATPSSKPKSTKDITPDWIRENFDLAKEWEFVEHKTHTTELHDIVRNTRKPISVTEFVNKLTKRVRELKKNLNVPTKAKAMISFKEDYYSEIGNIPSVFFSWKTPETEEETIKRLITREKSRLSREKSAARKKKEKEKKEKWLLKELKKKYEE